MFFKSDFACSASNVIPLTLNRRMSPVRNGLSVVIRKTSPGWGGICCSRESLKKVTRQLVFNLKYFTSGLATKIIICSFVSGVRVESFASSLKKKSAGLSSVTFQTENFVGVALNVPNPAFEVPMILSENVISKSAG